jgi:hypothetical protein
MSFRLANESLRGLALPDNGRAWSLLARLLSMSVSEVLV